MEVRKQTFKDKEFSVIKGAVHPDYSYFTFEEEERKFREKYWNISSGDVVFDVGAAYGSYTLPALASGATVFSFEPEPSVFSDLMTNVNINQFNKSLLFNCGLWSSVTSINMASYAPHWPQHTITTDYYMKTIDVVVDELYIEKLNWIKIDVEGAEDHVIIGGLKSISKFKPNLIVECHNFLDSSLKDKVKSLISSTGNYIFEEIERDPCIMLYAVPKKE